MKLSHRRQFLHLAAGVARSRPPRAVLGHKPIPRGRYAWSSDLPPDRQSTLSRA